MSTNLTALIIILSVLHVGAFAIMIMIRVWRNEADGRTGRSTKITPCAVCGEPATHWSYDGLDPNEQHDRHTGMSYSTDMAHYRPLCTAHRGQPTANGPAAANNR